MANTVYGVMIELQVLNYLFQKNSIQLISFNNITEDHFTTYKDQFKFIMEYYNKYSQLPSKETFQTKFIDNFEWLTITDPEDYLVDKLKEAKLYRELVGEYKKLSDIIKSGNSTQAVEKMAELSQKFLKEKATPVVDLITNVGIRYDNYLDRVANRDKAFVTTGLKELDDILGGWDCLNETAIIAARTGMGKSWWLIYFALHAAKQGLKVGYYSGEMETDLVGYRLDTFEGGIANGSLTRGNDNVKLFYEDYVKKLNTNVSGHIYCITPDMIDGSATITKLRAFIEKYELDMLCVDQFSLLEDEKRGRTPREQMSNLSKDLRALQRIKKIPILAASQLNREEQEDGPSTKNISESDRIGQDATTILFIERKDSDRIVFTVGKARTAKTGDKLTYNWNINMGKLTYIPADKDAKNGEGADELSAQYNDSGKSSDVF